MEWLRRACQQPNLAIYTAAQQRQAQLTKPAGALGELETIAMRLASLQQRVVPHIQHVHISVFAADHGVADEGVFRLSTSRYPTNGAELSQWRCGD